MPAPPARPFAFASGSAQHRHKKCKKFTDPASGRVPVLIAPSGPLGELLPSGPCLGCPGQENNRAEEVRLGRGAQKRTACCGAAMRKPTGLAGGGRILCQIVTVCYGTARSIALTQYLLAWPASRGPGGKGIETRPGLLIRRPGRPSPRLPHLPEHALGLVSGSMPIQCHPPNGRYRLFRTV